jgi:hypothetical protein
MPVGMNLASRVHRNLPGKSLRSAKDTPRSAEIDGSSWSLVHARRLCQGPADPMTIGSGECRVRGCAEYAGWPNQKKGDEIVESVKERALAPDVKRLTKSPHAPKTHPDLCETSLCGRFKRHDRSVGIDEKPRHSADDGDGRGQIKSVRPAKSCGNVSGQNGRKPTA